jgi:hypothetical protein
MFHVEHPVVSARRTIGTTSRPDASSARQDQKTGRLAGIPTRRGNRSSIPATLCSSW